MRSWLETAPRLAVALLCATITLAACNDVAAPEPASDPGAADLSLATAGVGGSDMVPHVVRATFGVASNANSILCAPTQAGVSVPAEYAGTGNVTHAGKSSITIVFDACTLVLPPGGSAAWTAQGHSTVTAANGDLIHVTFTMTQFVTGDFALDSFAIIGGTGRFANATGSMSGGGWIDLATGEGYFDFFGFITRPNS
jgi:hypothetical protein